MKIKFTPELEEEIIEVGKKHNLPFHLAVIFLVKFGIRALEVIDEKNDAKLAIAKENSE